MNTSELIDAATLSRLTPCLQGRTVFMAGCTGFVGKHLTDTLLYANDACGLNTTLLLLSRAPARFLEEMPHLRGRVDVRCIQGSVSDVTPDMLPDFDYMIHAVNVPQNGQDDWPARHIHTLIHGSEALYALAAAKGCAAVLFTSSGAVYGTGLSGSAPYSEDALPLVLSTAEIYGETKRFLEMYCAALGNTCGIRTVSARCFAFSGPHIPINTQNALGAFVADACAGRDIVIKGDGTPVRTFMYGADMALWLLTLLAQGKSGHAYNVGSEQAVTVAELANLVLRLSAGKGKVVVQGAHLQGNAPSRYVPDTSKIRKEFALAETVTLERGLGATLEWYKLAKSH